MQEASTYIKICAHHSVSALGNGENALNYYRYEDTFIKRVIANEKEYWAAPVDDYVEILIARFTRDFPKWNQLDRSTILALITAKAIQEKINLNDKNIIINAASSRGATSIWEKAHHQYINREKINIKTSPFTTLGNISNYITQFLNAQNAACIDSSITCSSGMQALSNGIAWIKSGMSDFALITATEAPLTGFTFAQMEALGIYSDLKSKYPCKPFSSSEIKKNTMILGEAAVSLLLQQTNELNVGDIYIDGIGFGNETITSPTSISANGDAFQIAMKNAINNSKTKEKPNVIVAHAPGTIKGDAAEFNAIQSIFGENYPIITSNKWKIGHTFAASGLMSIEMAIYMLIMQTIPNLPYPSYVYHKNDKPERIMINTMGFGGNATSIIIGIKK